MENAYIKAQETFKYFWRELSWENRRIVPALDLAMLKVAFVDSSIKDEELQTEYMWINEIGFDGNTINGVLINQPHNLTNIQEGDVVSIELKDVCDWMIASMGKVYGAFTVNLMRAGMTDIEREEHDTAWGLDFGDPDEIKLTIEGDADSEHPMSINMEASLRENLETSNDVLEYRDEFGGSMLHYEALAGNALQVKLLLEFDCDTLRI